MLQREVAMKDRVSRRWKHRRWRRVDIPCQCPIFRVTDV